MRLRHVILGWYYPQRETDRAGWLRAYIRNSRGLLNRLVHRFRTRDLNTKRGQVRLPLIERYLLTHPDTLWLLGFVGVKRAYCISCGDYGKPNEKVAFQEKFTECSGCGAYYCLSCQVDLKHICMNCRIPLNVLKVEVDLEQMSSEEEMEYFCGKYLKRAPHENFRVPPEEMDHATMMKEYEKMWKSWREANAARMSQQDDVSSEGSSEESNIERDASGAAAINQASLQSVYVTQPFPIANTNTEMPDIVGAVPSANVNIVSPSLSPLPTASKEVIQREHSTISSKAPADVGSATQPHPTADTHAEMPETVEIAQSAKMKDIVPPSVSPLPTASKEVISKKSSVSIQNEPTKIESVSQQFPTADAYEEMPETVEVAQSGKLNKLTPPNLSPLPSYSKEVIRNESLVSSPKAPANVGPSKRLSSTSKQERNANITVPTTSLLGPRVSASSTEKPYESSVKSIKLESSEAHKRDERPASQVPEVKNVVIPSSVDRIKTTDTKHYPDSSGMGKETKTVQEESKRPRKQHQWRISNDENVQKRPPHPKKGLESKVIMNTFTVRDETSEAGIRLPRKVSTSSNIPTSLHQNALFKEDKWLRKLEGKPKWLSEDDFDEDDMDVDTAFEDPMLGLELPELDRKCKEASKAHDAERGLKVSSVFDEYDMEVDTAMQDSALMRAIESDGFYDKKLSATHSGLVKRKKQTAKRTGKRPGVDADFDENDMSVDDAMNDPQLFADVQDDSLLKEGISDDFLKADL
ncbi:unnamed protein product [Schistocephalus solidus]|uniref:ZZ-type domain-containing protein n=1 Tax=Schistocephalus solidus TaxID=70667 RepID=A0A183SGB2_SCHSO|nr:unnamed protein product [Schistocephalus solidus]